MTPTSNDKEAHAINPKVDEKPILADFAVILFGALFFVSVSFVPQLSPWLWRASLAAMAARQWFILQPRFASDKGLADGLLANSVTGLSLLITAVLAVSTPTPELLVLVAMVVFCTIDLATTQRPLLEARISPQVHTKKVTFAESATPYLGLETPDVAAFERVSSATETFPVLAGICNALVLCEKLSHNAKVTEPSRPTLQRRASTFPRMLSAFAETRPADLDPVLVEHLEYLFEYTKSRIVPLYQDLSEWAQPERDTPLTAGGRKWLLLVKDYGPQFADHEAFLAQWVQDFCSVATTCTLSFAEEPAAIIEQLKVIATEQQAELGKIREVAEATDAVSAELVGTLQYDVDPSAESGAYTIADDVAMRHPKDNGQVVPPTKVLHTYLRRMYKHKYTYFGSVTGEERDDKGELLSDKTYKVPTLHELQAVSYGRTKAPTISGLDIYSTAQAAGARLLMVEGRTGVGKSTFAQQMARSQPSPDCFFVTVQIGTLSARLSQAMGHGQAISKLQLIAMSLCVTDRSDTPDERLCEAVEGIWASETPITWVLDGVDEVAQSTDPRIIGLLEDLLSSEEGSSLRTLRPNDLVVVMSRDDLRGSRYSQHLSNALTFRMEEWGDADIRDYIERYYACRPLTPIYAPDSASRLLLPPTIIEPTSTRSAYLGSFKRLPITCQLVCHLVSQDEYAFAEGVMINNMVDLYQQVCRSIYSSDRNRVARGMNPDVDFTEAEAFAQWRAIHLATSATGDVTFTTGVTEKSTPEEKNACKAFILSGFVRQVTERGSIYNRRYQFVHKAFVDYFTASALCEDVSRMKAFPFDIDETKQQRSLMVLVATKLAAGGKKYLKQRIAFEDKLVASFQTQYRSNKETANALDLEADAALDPQELSSTRIKRRDEFRKCCGMSTIAEILRINHELLAANNTSGGSPTGSPVTSPKFSSLSPKASFLAGSSSARVSSLSPSSPYLGQPTPLSQLDVSKALPTIKSPLFDRLDQCLSKGRGILRHAPIATKVPLFYGCMLLPLAEQNAVAALIFAHQHIKKGKETKKDLWRADGEFDRALLAAVRSGSREAEDLLVSSHFSASMDLLQAAELGAVRVLETLLVGKEVWNSVGTLALLKAAGKSTPTLRCLAELWRSFASDPAEWLALRRTLLDSKDGDSAASEEVADTVDGMVDAQWRSLNLSRLREEFQQAPESSSFCDGVDLAIPRWLQDSRSAILEPWTADEEGNLTLPFDGVFCSAVVDLNFSQTEVSDKTIISVAERCPQLQSLDVGKTKVTDTAIVAVAKRCSQLLSLNVAGTEGAVTDVGIAAVAERCPNLLSLNVSGTGGKVTDKSIVALAKKCPELVSLDVSETNGKVTDAAIKATAERCPNLATLDVRMTGGKVTDKAILAVAERCPQLRTLIVGSTGGKVTDAAVIAVAEHCPMLQCLDVTNMGGKVTDGAIFAVAECCPLLHSLSVGRGVTGAAIIAIVTRCSHLRSLDISRTAGKVSDAAIKAVAEHCPQLRSLNISFTDGAVSDKAIIAVAERCPLLESLNVSETWGAVTDAAVTAVAERCPRLKALATSKMEGKVTNRSIMAVASGCPQLERLDVSFTQGKVTNAAIKEVGVRCAQLKHLDISETDGAVTEDGITSLKSLRPLCSIIS